MSPAAIERYIHTAAVSIKMEGFLVELDCVAICKKMFAGEITMDTTNAYDTTQKAE